jgi:hypothetical protein
MNEDEQRGVDAARLLRVLADQAMAEGEREDIAGVTVEPSTADAAAAGMDLNSPRYRAAIAQLLEMGALVTDEETNALMSDDVVGEPEHGFALKITREGVQVLRELEQYGVWAKVLRATHRAAGIGIFSETGVPV